VVALAASVANLAFSTNSSLVLISVLVAITTSSLVLVLAIFDHFYILMLDFLLGDREENNLQL
jgi:hypothetical protein